MLTSEQKNNKANKSLIDASLFNVQIPKKILLAFFSFSSEYCIIPKEPLVKLISNFREIEQILKIDKSEIIHYLYFSYNKIHNILYDEEKEIQFNYDEKNGISYYFYLSLLIMANLEIINYKYNFEYIREVFNKVKSINERLKYKIVIMSELLGVLINNYIWNIDDDDEDEDEDENKKNENKNELKKIEEENNKIFTDNIIIFEEINLNFKEIKFKTIDEIYIIIINALIKLKKFEDYDFTYNIIQQLDLENIAITKLMYNELLKLLNEDADYINDYKITKKEDLFNEKKINFFYILLKYILKSPIYLYQITLLFDLKKFVMKLLNSNQISDKEIKSNKLQYLLWTLMDSEYYFSKIPESDYNKLKEILTYYKNFCFESKKDEIAILTNLLENNWGKYKIYLNDYDKVQKMNERYTIIKYFFENLKQKKNKEKIGEEELLKMVDKKINEKIQMIKFVFSLNENNLKENELNDSIKKWEFLEKMILDKKIKKMKKKEKIKLIKYFKNQENKEKLIEMYGEDRYEYIINSEIKIKDSKIDINLEKNENKNEIKEKYENIIKIEEKIDKKDYKKPLENKMGEIKNEFNEKFIDNSAPIPGINKEKYKSYEQIQLSKKITSNNSNYNNEVIPEESIGNSAPLFPLEIKNEMIYIMDKILKKSLILLKFDRELGNNLIFEEVCFGELNTKININKFKESLLISLNHNIIKKQNNIIYNYKNFSFFLKEIEERIINEFIHDYPLKIKMVLENKNNNSDPNISCIYTFFEPFTNQEYSFCEDNILVNGTNSNLQGFQFMIFQMNNECYANLKEKHNNRNIKAIEGNEYNILNGENNKKESLIFNNIEKNKFFNKKADEDKIIDFIDIIERNNNFIGLIKELNNGNYISYKNNHTIIFYDAYFNKIKEQRFDSITNITEITNYEDNKNKDISKIIISGYKEIILLTIDFKTSNIETKNLNEYNIYSISFFEIKKNNYIISGSNICMHILDLFNNNSNDVKKNIIESKSYFGGIKINENTIALTSNNLKEGGEDKIIFYNSKSKRILNEIEGYSHSISPNGLAIIQTEKIIMKSENLQKGKKNRKKRNKNKNTSEANEKAENEKLLLSACKRYRKKEENGILLINPQIQENKNVENYFYNTGNFEPYCFCQILIVENNNKNLDNIDDEYKKNIKIKETDYFLVGGFDEEKRRGAIKLYKVNFNEQLYNRKIEYLQDIELDDFFEGPINCIIQSRTSGNILVTCYNGNIYLFSQPNINFYLDEEEVEKDNNKLL